MQIPKNNKISLTNPGDEKTWNPVEVFNSYVPFENESLEEQNNLYKALVSSYNGEQLTEIGKQKLEFWKILDLEKIEGKQFNYNTQVSFTYPWKLEINREGISYSDLSNNYGSNNIYWQNFSDYYFYGPLMPIPLPEIRKQLIEIIRKAFLPSSSDQPRPFSIFDYPDTKSVHTPDWMFGNYQVSSFVNIRDFGVEYGRQNFRDGLVWLGYLSFEFCLTCPEYCEKFLGKKVLEEINQRTRRHCTDAIPLSSNQEDLISKHLFMENGGRVYQIQKGMFSQAYKATEADEEKWERELVENYKRRLLEETNEIVLKNIAETLYYHDCPLAEAILLQRAKTANDKEKQAIAYALWHGCGSEKSTDLLLSFLNYEDDYWKNYAFSAMGKMRSSKTTQAWVVNCLKGTDRYYYERALRVITFWGVYDEPLLSDSKLLKTLRWEEKLKETLGYNTALTRAINIVLGHPL
jgi:hypothetical protein